LRIWLMAARPRTLPAAIAPVLVGTAAAILEHGDLRRVWAFIAALIGSIFIQIGTNLSNDYSDAKRGADTVDRLGPVRVTAAGLAAPRSVFVATWLAFGVAVAAGIYLAIVAGWIIIAVGAASIAAGVLYTGGPRPYGYAGLGEVAVFVFFGPVAVLGTTLTQSGPPNALAIVSSIGVGMLTCAVLVANNLRDIPTDELVGKRTLAVILGDRDTRRLYAALVLLPFLLTVLGGVRSWPVLLGLVALPAAVLPVRKVLGGADGRPLIRVLGQTGLLLLAWSVLTGVGLALGTLV
jgi:1,4-dihydroxy-2-naphthoate polyprenyltransferase